MKKIAAIALSVGLLFSAFFVGTAVADDISLGNSGVEFRAKDNTWVSSSQGEVTSYTLSCPTGLKVISGGGVAFRTFPGSGTEVYNIEASYPLDADTWNISSSASSGASVRVHIICANLS